MPDIALQDLPTDASPSGTDTVAGDNGTATSKFTLSSIATLFNASPALTGTPTAPTAVAGTNTTQIATTAHVFAERTNAATLENKTFVAPALGTPASGTLTNCTGLPVSTGISGLAAGVATFLATPSSANLRGALTDETGTGAAVFATAPTISAPTVSGVITTDGPTIQTSSAMAALEIDVTKGVNTKSIAADSTLTFSAAPATDTWFSLILTNTDTNPHVITIPSSYSYSLQANITTLVIGASSRILLPWRRTASGYELFGDTSYLNNYSGTAAPTVNDDVLKGYGPGSIWLDATGNNAYICESNTATAAVWHQLGGGGGGAVSITGTPSVGQVAEWTSASAIQGVSTTGSGNYVRATSPTLVTPVLGTPASGTLTNCTGLPVAGGGTGVATLTAYAPIFGGTTGTGAVQSGTVGTAGQVLTSNGAGALPTFQAPASAGYGFQHDYKFWAEQSSTSTTAGQLPASHLASVVGTIVSSGTSYSTSYGAPRGVCTGSDGSVNSGVFVFRGKTTSAFYVPGATDSQQIIFEAVFACVDANAGRRWAEGFYINGGAAPSVSADPETWVNIAIFGKDNDDSNIQVMTNDATSTAAKVDLGANFPATAGLYYARLVFTGGATRTLDYYIKRIDTGNTASGQITADLPVANTAGLTYICWGSNGPTTASAVTFEHSFMRLTGRYTVG